MIDLNLSGALSWFSSLAGRFLSDNVLKFAAWKVLLFSLLTVSLPVVVKNIFVWLFEQIVSIAQQNADFSQLASVVLEFTGFAAYLAVRLQLSDCFSILITALAIRTVLNFIPFIG